MFPGWYRWYSHILTSFPGFQLGPWRLRWANKQCWIWSLCSALFRGWLANNFRTVHEGYSISKEHDDQKNRSLDVGYPISLEQSSSAMPLQAISLRANHAQYYQAIPRHDCGVHLEKCFCGIIPAPREYLRVMQVVSKSFISKMAWRKIAW